MRSEFLNELTVAREFKAEKFATETRIEKDFKAAVDRDDVLHFEQITFFRRLIDFIWIPILNRLPEKIGISFFIKSSRDGKKVRDFARTFRALEIFYAFDGKLHFKEEIKNPFQRFIDALFTWIWQHVHNVQAVRNRLKIVVRELNKAIEKLDINQVNLVSLGAGSARAVIETTANLNHNGRKIKVVLIDVSQAALDYNRMLAEEFRIFSDIERIKGRAEKLLQYCLPSVHIVEMVGLADYFRDNKAVKLFRVVFQTLAPGGYFIVSNIRPNPEEPFVKRIIGWKGMYYRNEKDLMKLLMEAGFSPAQIKLFVEPQNIHTVAVARKFV